MVDSMVAGSTGLVVSKEMAVAQCRWRAGCGDWVAGQRPETRKCFLCGKIEHLKKDCSTKKQAQHALKNA